MFVPPLFFFFVFFLLASLSSCTLPSTLSPTQTLTDNGQTLISTGQTFALGFFSPSNSTNRYIGIWFNNIAELTPIWVANRDNPLTDSSGILTITPSGNIVITRNGTNTVFWSSNSSSTNRLVSNPVLQLLDNGNLVVTVNDSTNYSWECFEHPSDTLIPGMELGWNLETNQEWFLTSWRNLQDPASGDYTYRMDSRGLLEAVLRRGSQIEYRSGPWDGVRFGGGPKVKESSVVKPIIVFNSTQIYYAFENIEESIISMMVVTQNGQVKHFSWSERRNKWVDIVTMQQDNCDNYRLCGPYGICSMNTQQTCTCPSGFRPSLEQDWEKFDWSGGCVRKVALNCSAPEGFRKFTKLKLPDSSLFLVNKTVTNLVECKEVCLRNCSCVAYAKTEASGCVVWFGDLLDITEYNDGGQDLYIRMDASQLGSSNKERRKIVIASVSVISGILLLGLISFYVFRWIAAKRKRDDSRSNFLGWRGRYDVIIGIARGLLYLHRDSRLRIIHRDLKASNVLLDNDMNPKISDFGTARAFGADQNLAKTKRVVGTYGYMSPEYAIDGIFSVKSDVFSFGVLVLEIVSGKRNRQFRHPDHDLNLLGHAWKLWTEGKAFDLLDPLMVDSVSLSEVVKCIQVGLLCVQHRPEDRPTMSSVLLLLDSVSAMLPQPKHPGFYIERTSDEDEETREMTNVLTNTLSEGR